MAILGKWSGGTVAITPGTTWAAPASLFPTEDRNDSSAYTFTASTSTLTLPSSGLADGYLLIGAFEFEDTSNGRHNPQGKIVQASGTGTLVGSPTSGFNRDNSEDRSYVRCWSFVDGPSASSTYQFQWKRDTDSPTGGTVRSEFQVIPFYYSDIGLYSSTSTTHSGGTTPVVQTGYTGTDGTNITIASSVISVTGDNKRYLVLGSQYYEGGSGNTRTQRWYGLDVDGVQEDAAKGYAYMRNNANDNAGEFYTWLVETATATVTLENTIYRGDGVSNLQGGADVDGSTTATTGDHSIVVIELNDTAEVFRARDNTQSALLATTGPVDLQINTVTDFNDTASFTDLVDSSINVVQTSDCLFGANISAASNAVANTTRWTAYAELTVNGTEDADSFAGDYMRNNQGTIDTFGWSANLLGFQSLTAGDDVGVSVTELVGSEGGGAAVSPAGWSGFWGINLDTLAASADTEISATSQSLTLTENNATIAYDIGITATSQSLTLTEYAAVVDLGVNVSATSQALTLTENNATVTFDVNISATSQALTLTQHNATVDLSTNVSATSQSLVLTEYAATVSGTEACSFDADAFDTDAFDINSFLVCTPSGDTSINATSQALTLTENNTTITYDVSLTATSQALTLTEQNAAIAYDISLSATSQALTLTANNATISLDVGISATSQSLTLTEFPANVGLNKEITATSQALSLTANNATIAHDIGISATSQSLTLTANPATITFDVGVSATSQALNLTTHAATVSLDQEITATSQALTLTEFPASVALNVDISATSQALTLTAYNTVVSVGTTIAATSQALTLTEYPASVSLDVDIAATSQALTLTANNATVSYGVNVNATSQALSLTEHAATIAYDVNIQATSDTLTLTQNNATVSYDFDVQATSQPLTLTSYNANISVDVEITATHQAMSLVEMKATVTAGPVVVITPTESVLSLIDTGNALLSIISEGDSAQSQINNTGLSLLSEISASTGVISCIYADGVGVESTITSETSVQSTILGVGDGLISSISNTGNSVESQL